MAAVTFTIALTFTESVRAGGDSRPVTLHMLGTACVGFVVVVLRSGHFHPPQTVHGWFGFVGVTVFYSFAIIYLYVAMSSIGRLRTALVMNLEPVFAVVFGYLLLGQRLAALQLLGVALVVAAVVLIERSKSRGEKR